MVFYLRSTTSSYLGNKKVGEPDPYGKAIKKLDCIGHIQTRVSRKLRNLKDDGLFKCLYDVENGKKKKPQKVFISQTKILIIFKAITLSQYAHVQVERYEK